ncbi:MAG: hypothetical protein GX023_10030 [Tissierellia bacterium]|nr:hypothetical protein [Tissierellia bacterium]
MVNPLARVVMDNVAKKANPNSQTNTSISRKIDDMNIKSLDNVVSSIRKDYKGNEKKDYTVNRPNLTNKVGIEKKVNNLTLREEKLIRDLIKGEEVVRETVRKENSTVTMISLDEAVNSVKGNR